MSAPRKRDVRGRFVSTQHAENADDEARSTSPRLRPPGWSPCDDGHAQGAVTRAAARMHGFGGSIVGHVLGLDDDGPTAARGDGNA